MRIKEIVSALERFAPLPLQDGFDNAGLQIGLTEAEATGALLCLDVTEAVLDEAIALGYNLVISHHPLIFKGYKSITGRDYVEHCIMKAIKNDIVIYSAHTNLDNAPGGVNFKIAEKIGLSNVRVLEAKENTLVKLVTFVPTAQANVCFVVNRIRLQTKLYEHLPPVLWVQKSPILPRYSLWLPARVHYSILFSQQS